MNSQLAMHLPPRIARWALPVVLALVAAAVTPAGAQDAAPYEAVIVGAAEVPVRANADEQFYPLAILTPGTIVTVTGERRGFLRVDLSTRAFTNTTYGIIKYPRNAAALVSPDTPGQRGRATGPVAVFGPNLGTDDPIGDGWKRVGDVASGAAIDVRDRTVVGDEVILRVAAPRGTSGWIRADRVARATPAQVDAWLKSLEAPVAMPAPVTPRPAPATTPPVTPAPQPVTPKPTTPATTPGTVVPPSAIPATPTTTPVTPAAAPPSAPTETPAPVAPPAETTPVAPVLPRELPTMPEPSADAKASAMLDRLDVRLGALRDEPLASAEVQPLRQLYLAIAENPEVETDALRDYAKTRARQLEVWSQTQQKLRDLDALTARLDRAGERSRLGVLALESGIAYTAVGRLVSSTIFDGRGLPQLLRVQDSGSGRTVVYIDASQAPQATGHLGLMVGIVGEKRFDPSLRLHVVRPTRIDTLSPQR